MHSGTKFFQNLVKIQWHVASIFSQTSSRRHLVTSFTPKRSMQRCLPQNVPVCPAMCLPASKCLCLLRNCKDMDLLLALQLATREGNNVFNRGLSRQSSHKVIRASHRSQIAAASQPHRRKTYRQEPGWPDCSSRASMQASPNAVLEPRDSLTQISLQNA